MHSFSYYVYFMSAYAELLGNTVSVYTVLNYSIAI